MADIVPLLWLLNIYQYIRWLVKDILLPISCSVFASYVFWHIASNAFTTKIKFASNIEAKRISLKPNKKRYRIKLINTGPFDIYEAEYIIQFSYIPQKKTRRVLTLNISQRFNATILYGRKYQERYQKTNCSRFLEILEPKNFYSNFRANVHSLNIVNAAKNKTLTLTDVFNEYQKSMRITVLVFGIDSFTGVRRFFKSQTYKYKDVVEGKYNYCSLEGKSYSKYVGEVLKVVKPKVKSGKTLQKKVK